MFAHASCRKDPSHIMENIENPLDYRVDQFFDNVFQSLSAATFAIIMLASTKIGWEKTCGWHQMAGMGNTHWAAHTVPQHHFFHAQRH